MVLTHLLFFTFFTGATEADAPPAPPVVVDVGGRGNWNLNKRNPPKRGKTIRFSDFETQEEFAAAMREVIRIPMAEVSDAPVIATDDDEDDELLLLAVMRILH